MSSPQQVCNVVRANLPALKRGGYHLVSCSHMRSATLKSQSLKINKKVWFCFNSNSNDDRLTRSMSVSVHLEFKVVEREVPDLDSTSKSGIRRGKIKEHDIPKWVSLWIPWENYMDVTGFVRNLKRELAAVGLAARGDVDRDLRARIAEANILAPPKQTQTILDDESSHSKSLHH